MKSTVKYILFFFFALAITIASKFFLGPNVALSGVSPVIALALFSGFIARDKDRMFLLPLTALLVSDACMQLLYEQNLFPYAGFYAGQWKNYLLLLTLPLIAAVIGATTRTRMIAGAIAGPTVYFILSNLFVWMQAGEAVYTKDINGLMQCYTMALPFYRNSLLATIVFLPMLLITYRQWVLGRAYSFSIR
ncbi:MAG: DUF6580 family putative transport protein [Bacteroidota bacterium]